jgi:hypothetical protein
MRILVQCTIPYAADDWHVGRFSLLIQALREAGHGVVARDLAPSAGGADPVLSRVSRDEFDELWLLGVDAGQPAALTMADVAGINAFHRTGGGLITARDHENMGRWLQQIEGVGRGHYFDASGCYEPDPDRARSRTSTLTS